MLLDSNTEKVMNLVDMVDDLKGIGKTRLAIHILEENYFSTEYDENFIKLLRNIEKKLDDFIPLHNFYDTPYTLNLQYHHSLF